MKHTDGPWKDRTVAEVPEECRKDHWIVGFDTAHLDDTIYKWPKDAVILHAEFLANQLEPIAETTEK